jgi:tRNA-splicing ligase RtcB
VADGLDQIRLDPAGTDRWEITPFGSMQVPGVVFASEALLPDVATDRSLEQVCNVATLPGIVTASYAMPDIHWGYGFPIGGVAATDVDAGGVVAPGGVGFDISCGVRLLVSDLDHPRLTPHAGELMDGLGHAIPRGVGRGGVWAVDDTDLERILRIGARHAVARGFGRPEDLDRCEERGAIEVDDISGVSERARARGMGQVGSLGSGNHFLEVQRVDTIFDEPAAAAFGLFLDQICVLIHTGSRGLGHQVCSDHTATMGQAMARHGISVPDRQLACVPVRSTEGERYLDAMRASANFGRANRQVLTHGARQVFEDVTRTELRLLYDVSHNLAKLETHEVDGEPRLLCVHRKGATRALPPHHPDLPSELAAHGQPVLVPGSMGTSSYVLAGATGSEAFHSTCHGAGRAMSRTQARKKIRGEALERQLEDEGIMVRGASAKGLAEEAPFAYKDVDEVVLTCERAGLARRVARLVPVGVVKG